MTNDQVGVRSRKGRSGGLSRIRAVFRSRIAKASCSALPAHRDHIPGFRVDV